MDTVTGIILSPVVMMLLGAFAHLLANVVRLRSSGEDYGLRSYIRSRPYTVTLNVVGALIATALLHDSGQLTPMAAVGVGYAGDSVLKNMVGPASDRALQSIKGRMR